MDPSNKLKTFNEIYDIIKQEKNNKNFSATCQLLEDYQIFSGERIMMLAEEDLYIFKDLMCKIKLNLKEVQYFRVKNRVNEYLAGISRYSVLEKSEELEINIRELLYDDQQIKEQLDKLSFDFRETNKFDSNDDLKQIKISVDRSKRTRDKISEINIENMYSEILELQLQKNRFKKENKRLNKENNRLSEENDRLNEENGRLSREIEKLLSAKEN